MEEEEIGSSIAGRDPKAEGSSPTYLLKPPPTQMSPSRNRPHEGSAQRNKDNTSPCSPKSPEFIGQCETSLSLGPGRTHLPPNKISKDSSNRSNNVPASEPGPAQRHISDFISRFRQRSWLHTPSAIERLARGLHFPLLSSQGCDEDFDSSDLTVEIYMRRCELESRDLGPIRLGSILERSSYGPFSEVYFGGLTRRFPPVYEMDDVEDLIDVGPGDKRKLI
ncbi:uncharacterized protein BDR25DRAFT_308461 [Lindgomyces ingoldianus]|uniref:Uncharacterized protein n=1 Tax=Lindgomyces ingoldianus TaxID=673940 RepID=A0ACB6RES4_9PLEO|nr:uncharacterized protein BDR25DRAFT_308461 [Lindgomyces ingoldianus]KAF2477555.1 hypothetical protein BDR25DRAFT_308461 [Lindgomyces ingoldianus]